jgi:hypothetical protein
VLERSAAEDGFPAWATGLGHWNSGYIIGCLGLCLDQVAQRLQRSILRIAPCDEVPVGLKIP